VKVLNKMVAAVLMAIAQGLSTATENSTTEAAQ